MVAIAGSAISRPAGMRLAAIAAAAITSLAAPPVGVPLALGLAGYLAIILSKPNQIVRGRTLSAGQRRRAALVVASVVFGLGALTSATLAALNLAGRLESRLYDRIDIAAGAGALRLGESLRQCEEFACARATIVRLATDNTFGIAELHGFALDDLHAYGRHQPAGPGEWASAQRTRRSR
jgi:hypothetical protein